ncbi:MAG: hypothetical protein ABI318_22585, partial [Chthoniobacteraceae bacterium]
ARAKALHATYDQLLERAQTQLTQHQRFDDALLVKAKREEVAAAWMTPAIIAAVSQADAPSPAAVAVTKPPALGKVGLGADPGRNVLPTMAPGGPRKEGAVVVSKPDGIRSHDTFSPPVAITYVLKTSDQVRLRYAAEQIIFNWEKKKTELRIDGGPAASQHRQGVGTIPVNQFITIRQVVLPDKMTISVDGEERASWQGDFTKVKQEIGIMAFKGSIVSVKQVLVNQMK